MPIPFQKLYTSQRHLRYVVPPINFERGAKSAMKKRVIPIISAFLFTLPLPARAKVTDGHFELDTTADLVSFCGVSDTYPCSE